MPMQKSTPAANPDAYVAALSGWQQRYVAALREATRDAARDAAGTTTLQEVIRWGHIVCYANGPVLLIRAEAQRVLFGFWRGRRLRHLEPRLKPGGRYELATLELREGTPLARTTVIALVQAATALNASLGDPTVLPPVAD